MSDDTSAVMTEEKEAAAMTMEDFLRSDEEAFGTPKHGDIVDGVVVRVDADEVLVDIGAKAEGIISGKELGFRGDPDQELSPGDNIKVYVLQPENEEGNVVLSLRRARAETTWLVAAEKQEKFEYAILILLSTVGKDPIYGTERFQVQAASVEAQDTHLCAILS